MFFALFLLYSAVVLASGFYQTDGGLGNQFNAGLFKIYQRYPHGKSDMLPVLDDAAKMSTTNPGSFVSVQFAQPGLPQEEFQVSGVLKLAPIQLMNCTEVIQYRYMQICKDTNSVNSRSRRELVETAELNRMNSEFFDPELARTILTETSSPTGSSGFTKRSLAHESGLAKIKQNCCGTGTQRCTSAMVNEQISSLCHLVGSGNVLNA